MAENIFRSFANTVFRFWLTVLEFFGAFASSVWGRINWKEFLASLAAAVTVGGGVFSLRGVLVSLAERWNVIFDVNGPADPGSDPVGAFLAIVGVFVASLLHRAATGRARP